VDLFIDRRCDALPAGVGCSNADASRRNRALPVRTLACFDRSPPATIRSWLQPGPYTASAGIADSIATDRDDGDRRGENLTARFMRSSRPAATRRDGFRSRHRPEATG